jgi:hypothetical protein
MESLIFTCSDDRWLVSCHLSSWDFAFYPESGESLMTCMIVVTKLDRASVGLQINNRVP